MAAVTGTGNGHEGGSYSEKIAMVIVTGVIVITAGTVAGIIILLYQSKAIGNELPMIASAGFALLAAGMKTSPDTTKKPAPSTVTTGSDATVTVTQPPAEPTPGDGDGA